MKSMNEDTKICDVLDMNPVLEKVLLSHGLNCAGCPGGNTENLREAAEGHNVDLKTLLEDLKKANEL